MQELRSEVWATVTLSRMDAAMEPPWMGSRRVTVAHTSLMSSGIEANSQGVH